MKQKNASIIKYVPNILSSLRLGMIPIFVLLFFTERRLMSGGIFVLAGLTDGLDGYIARRYNAISKLGRILDPLADKTMQFAALLSLALIGDIPLWFAIVYLIKEIIMFSGGIKLYSIVADVMTSRLLGKIAATALYISLAYILCFKTNLQLRYSLLTICLTLAVAALVDYILSYSIYVKIRRKE